MSQPQASHSRGMEGRNGRQPRAVLPASPPSCANSPRHCAGTSVPFMIQHPQSSKLFYYDTDFTYSEGEAWPSSSGEASPPRRSAPAGRSPPHSGPGPTVRPDQPRPRGMSAPSLARQECPLSACLLPNSLSWNLPGTLGLWLSPAM